MNTNTICVCAVQELSTELRLSGPQTVSQGNAAVHPVHQFCDGLYASSLSIHFTRHAGNIADSSARLPDPEEGEDADSHETMPRCTLWQALSRGCLEK